MRSGSAPPDLDTSLPLQAENARRGDIIRPRSEEERRNLLPGGGDGGRLSLEAALTGIALALTLTFLLENPAQALEADGRDGARPDDPLREGASPGGATAPPTRSAHPASASEGSEGTVPGSAAAAGSQSPTHGTQLSSLAALGGQPSGFASRSPQPISADAQPAPFSGPGFEAVVPSPRLPIAATPGAEAAAFDPSDQSGPSDPSDLPAAVPITVASPGNGDAVNGIAKPEGGRGVPGELPTLEPAALPVPARQSLQIRIDRQESVVARTVEGVSSVVLNAHQTGLQGTRLDATQSWRPEISVDSIRRNGGLALSALDAAQLHQKSLHQAVSDSAIAGPAGGSYRITALDVLRLGLQGEQGGQIAVDARVEGLVNSLLSAEAEQGQTSLSIAADLELSLGGAAGSGSLQGRIELFSTAVNRSRIRLGADADTVQIASRIGRNAIVSPLAFAPAAANWQAVTVNSRAVGLGNSELITGDGADLVTIETEADEALALENSLVQLGGGDDRLLLRGGVLGSRIEPGEGRNRVEASAAVHNSVLGLNGAGVTNLRLSAADDSIRVEGEGGVIITAGDGDDRLQVAGSPIGLLDGGAGQDTLELLRSGQRGPQGPLPPQEVEIQGANRGRLDALTFASVESILLPDGGSRVRIDPLGSLEGSLQGGAGIDSLDYGAWSSGITVDLGQGSAGAVGNGGASRAPGFEGVLGGTGADHLIAGADSLWIDGGAGDDWLEFNLFERTEGAAPLRITGSGGRDLFVLAGLDPLLLASPAALESSGSHNPGFGPSTVVPSLRGQFSLADLALTLGPAGELQLSDRLALRSGGILAAGASAAEDLVELIPSGLDGLGQSRRLPIASLPALLAGIGSGAPQLAIATDPVASQLVLLGPSRFSVELALLPALHDPAADPGTPLRS